MSSYLLAISIGPVGGFIAAGRRSRDLWWGSTWLSECVRHVAEKLGEPRDGSSAPQLLLPSKERIEALTKDRKTRRDRLYGGRVANKLLLRVGGEGDDPKKIADHVKGLATEARRLANHWLAEKVKTATSEAQRREGNFSEEYSNPLMELLIDGKLVSKQIEAIKQGDFVEVRAAWLEENFPPTDPDEKQGWKNDIKNVLRLRDASPRLFRAAYCPETPRAKCDLDPGRDSVLRKMEGEGRGESQKEKANKLHKRLRGQLGIREGEHLDGLYLARRMALFLDEKSDAAGPPLPRLPPLPFPPVGRVAVEPWLRGLSLRNGDVLRRLRVLLDEAYGEGEQPDFYLWCSPCRAPGPLPSRENEVDSPTFFPYDPSVLFEGGREALEKDLDRAGLGKEKTSQRSFLSATAPLVNEAHRTMQAPPIPYYAMVEMDGDGVGMALESMAETDWKKAVEMLYQFSDAAARATCDREGVPFYAAADELLFYAPVDQALCIVVELNRIWSEQVQKIMLATSLSAGIAIVHVKDDMDAARKAAGKALKEAKDRKKSAKAQPDEDHSGAYLTVLEQPRAGGARGVTGRMGELAHSLMTWTDMVESGGEEMSLRTAHILDEYLRRLMSEASFSKDEDCNRTNDKDALPEPLSPVKKSEREKREQVAIHLAHGAILRQLRASGLEGGALKKRIHDLKCRKDIQDLVNELLLGARIGRVAAQRRGGES